MPPVTVSPWREVLRADTFGPVCPQNLPEVMMMMLMVNLTVAHLRIGHMEGNPEVGNSEYMGHQDCPPQL